MTDTLTFTKRVAKSGRGYLVWIPKDIIDFLNIKKDDTVEMKIRRLKKSKGDKK
jgi:antitoxin component of MazEF toxin-antitoxin module